MYKIMNINSRINRKFHFTILYLQNNCHLKTYAYLTTLQDASDSKEKLPISIL